MPHHACVPPLFWWFFLSRHVNNNFGVCWTLSNMYGVSRCKTQGKLCVNDSLVPFHNEWPLNWLNWCPLMCYKLRVWTFVFVLTFVAIAGSVNCTHTHWGNFWLWGLNSMNLMWHSAPLIIPSDTARLAVTSYSCPTFSVSVNGKLSAQYWGELRPNSPTYTRFPNLLYTAELLCIKQNKNKVLPHYVNSPCHKVADAGNSTSSFSISAILHSCMLATAVFYLLISWLFLDIPQLFVLGCVGLYL